jgi:1,5-anhydro-D-fructose reductase (1,5-anhydro-D-mannitol-forming)
MNEAATAGAMTRVRWGIIGCGDVTEVKSGPAFGRVPNSSLAAVMRRDAAKAEDYARRHGVPRWTSDADEIVEADDVDAVYVATPPSSHAQYVLRAAAAGKPVYVEKPMALSGAEADAMVTACEAAGVPLFVAYYRRALPRFAFVGERIAAGAVGDVALVRLELHHPAPDGPAAAGWRWDPDIAGGGLLFDLGSHALDLLDHWLGPIARVEAFRATRLPWARVEDQVVAAFEFASGVQGAAVWGFNGTTRRDRMTVVGTRGSISVPLFADGPIVLEDASGQLVEHRISHPPHVQEPLIATIVGELTAASGGAGPRCPSTGVTAARTQRVLEALLGDTSR